MLIRWLLNSLALILVTYLVPGIAIRNFYIALIAALVIGLINITIKPLVLILTLPLNILTLGLLTFVINGLLFWFASSFIKGFEVSGFIAAFLGALVYSVLSWFINRLAN